MSTTGASDDEHTAAGNAASSRVAGYELPLTEYTNNFRFIKELASGAVKAC